MSKKKVIDSTDLEKSEKLMNELKAIRENPPLADDIIDKYMEKYGHLLKWEQTKIYLLVATFPIVFILFYFGFTIGGETGDSVGMAGVVVFFAFPMIALIFEVILSTLRATPDVKLIFRLCYLSKQIRKLSEDKHDKTQKKKVKNYLSGTKKQLQTLFGLVPITLCPRESNYNRDKVERIYFRLLSKYVGHMYNLFKKNKLDNHKAYADDLYRFAMYLYQEKFSAGINDLYERNLVLIPKKQPSSIVKALKNIKWKPIRDRLLEAQRPPEEKRRIINVDNAVIWALSFVLAYLLINNLLSLGLQADLQVVESVFRRGEMVLLCTYLGLLFVAARTIREIILSVWEPNKIEEDGE